MTIIYMAELAALAGKSEEKWPQRATVADLLSDLAERYGPPLNNRLLPADGSVPTDIFILLNGQHIRHLQGLATPLGADDEISLIPLIEGG